MIKRCGYTIIYLALAGACKGLLACPNSNGFSEVPQILLKQTTLVIGEVHGNNEMPAFVADLACAHLQRGRKILLGLELDVISQAALNSYMESNGMPEDIQQLTQAVPKGFDVGITSQARLNLVESMRKARAAGSEVRLFAFVNDASGQPYSLGGQANYSVSGKDMLMAQQIEYRREEYPDHVLLVLVGNVHAKKSKGNFASSQYKPMAFQLGQRMPVYTLLLASNGGNYWGCTGRPISCGIKTTSIRNDPVGKIEFLQNDYDAAYNVGALSPAMPWGKEVKPPLDLTYK